MSRLWLLRGALDAPGWKLLQADQKAEKVDIVQLDPPVWALVRADQPPTGYDGLDAREPPDGMYLDPNGSPMYLAAGEPVRGPMDVIQALGNEARALLEKVKDPDLVLERLGRVF
jgi:hypothetical protein